MPKISVISPVYRVEKFIGKAVESMFSQTLDDVEFIFVDDATPDKSIIIIYEILKQFPNRENQVRIIRHDVNKGLPTARNTGLRAATGTYIFHWDSDDYADSDMLEKMYNHATKGNFDIIWTDWFLTFEKSERYMKQPTYGSPRQALKAMLGGAMKYNVWNKLAKRSLYSDYNILFPDGFGMGEDVTMMLLFARAEKVSHLDKAFYHYIKTNTDAFSHGVDEKHFKDLHRNILWISENLKLHNTYNFDKEINFLKLQSKYPLIANTGNIRMYKLWNEWFPEANNHILNNPYCDKRSRFLQYMAFHRQYWIIWLHYMLISKIVYGIIFR